LFGLPVGIVGGRMNYLELPNKTFNEFVINIRDKYGLIISERPVSVHLDKNKWAAGWVAWKRTYKFYALSKDGEKDFVTIQNGNGNIIVAVTDFQYKSWKKRKFFSERHEWSLGRCLDCMAQIMHRFNLINPFKEIYKVRYFLWNLFNGGEKNGQEEFQ